MEIEALFSSTRWEIIRQLSSEKLSPMELAERLNTTSANVSQQLRLLELGGLVQSERTSNVEKGKPRVVYSIAGRNAFLIMARPGFADKKLLSLNAYQNFMLNSFFLSNPEHHPLVSDFYCQVKDELSKVDAVAAESSGSSLTIYYCGALKSRPAVQKVRVVASSMEELAKKQGIIVLYDPKNRLGGIE